MGLKMSKKSKDSKYQTQALPDAFQQKKIEMSICQFQSVRKLKQGLMDFDISGQ